MNIEVLYDEQKIKERTKKLAREIEEYFGDEDIVLICVLKGSIFFFTDLAKAINKNVIIDFMQVSSYEGTSSTGKINFRLDVKSDLKGKNVIVVEDIIDTGRTLKYLVDYLEKKYQSQKIKICTLLDKKEKRIEDISADFVGFEIPDKFVIGYGLDYNDKYRNLPYIGFVKND